MSDIFDPFLAGAYEIRIQRHPDRYSCRLFYTLITTSGPRTGFYEASGCRPDEALDKACAVLEERQKHRLLTLEEERKRHEAGLTPVAHQPQDQDHVSGQPG